MSFLHRSSKCSLIVTVHREYWKYSMIHFMLDVSAEQPVTKELQPQSYAQSGHTLQRGHLEYEKDLNVMYNFLSTLL